MTEINIILNRLSGETTVDAFILSEDKGLMALLRAGSTYDEALKYVNEHY